MSKDKIGFEIPRRWQYRLVLLAGCVLVGLAMWRLATIDYHRFNRGDRFHITVGCTLASMGVLGVPVGLLYVWLGKK